MLIPSSWNPAGTESNRWAASKSPKGRGLNSQTVPKVMRIMVDSPPGRMFLQPDLPQADARVVAWDARCVSMIELFLDDARHIHLENCEKLFKRKITKEDLEYTQGKAMIHAANYRMMAKRLAMELGIKVAEAKRLLSDYFIIYPEIPVWHATQKNKVKANGYLETPFPFRKRTFYKAIAELMLTGKISNDSHNEICAWVPSSTVADLITKGLRKVWDLLPDVRLHHHGHDSFLLSFVPSKLKEVAEVVIESLKIPLVIHGRELLMVPEVEVGYSWGLMFPWQGEGEVTREMWMEKVRKSGKMDREKIRKELYGYY